MNKIEVVFMYHHFEFDNIEEAKQLYDLLNKSYDWNKETIGGKVLLLNVTKDFKQGGDDDDKIY